MGGLWPLEVRCHLPQSFSLSWIRCRPNITIFFTILAVAVSFAWLGVDDPAQWRSGVGLYILGRSFIPFERVPSSNLGPSHHLSSGTPHNVDIPITNHYAVRPHILDRRIPRPCPRSSRGQSFTARDCGGHEDVCPPLGRCMALTYHRLQDHDGLTSLSRNRLSNTSFAVCSAGEIVVLAIMVGILKGMKSDASTENNTRAFSALIAFAGGVWLLCAIPWFVLEKRRPGLSLPSGTSLLTVGFKQTYVAFRECMRLKQTFLYLIFYFLMCVQSFCEKAGFRY